MLLAALLLSYTALPLHDKNHASEPVLSPDIRAAYTPADYKPAGLENYLAGFTSTAGGKSMQKGYSPVSGLLDVNARKNKTITASDAAALAEPAWSRFSFWKAEPSVTGRVCKLSLNNYERELRTTIALIDALHDDGLTAPERSFRNDCFSSLEVPASMAAFDAGIRKQIKGNTLTQNLMQQHFNDWLPRRHWITARIGDSEFTKRAEAVQALSDHIRLSYGLDPVPVYLVNLPKVIPLLGHYVPKYRAGKPAIIINAAQWAGLMDKPEKLLPVLLEEVRHSIDHAAMQRLRNQTLSPSDPQFFHAAIIAMNLQPAGYSRSNDGTHDADEEDLNAIYSSQYVERTAKNFASALTGDLLALQ